MFIKTTPDLFQIIYNVSIYKAMHLHCKYVSVKMK